MRTWAKRVGEHELSLIPADRAVSCAYDADDRELAGAAAWNLAMILSAQGRVDEAYDVSDRALDEARRWPEATSSSLAVRGGLMLMAATLAARRDERVQTRRWLDVAQAIARRTGETNHHRMAFCPTNVGVHRVSTATELGRTQEALDAAMPIAIDAAPTVERRLTFRLDLARCYARRRDDVASIHMLTGVHRESPEELRYNPMARETLRELIGHRTLALGRVGTVAPGRRSSRLTKGGQAVYPTACPPRERRALLPVGVRPRPRTGTVRNGCRGCTGSRRT